MTNVERLLRLITMVILLLLWPVMAVWGTVAGVVRALLVRARSATRSGGRLVVIGGGFAGALIAKLSEDSFRSVTLIDQKSYWEYTPSVPSILGDQKPPERIQLEHTVYLAPSTTVELGQVREVDMASKCVLVYQDGFDSKRVEFDHLVLCTGTNYAKPFRESRGGNVVLASRAQHLHDARNKIQSARRILIIGGGIVGGEVHLSVTGLLVTVCACAACS